jgi:hypothetical protein
MSNGKLTQKINCETITRGSVICRNMPHYTQKRSAVIHGDFESCADILITSYWLHVEFEKNI